MDRLTTHQEEKKGMPYGYNGKILRVNLSSGEISTEEPEEDIYRSYFGGTSLVAYYLLRELKPGIDPLGPDNKLIFATGPVTGVPLAGSGRHTVGAKSPLTGAFGDAQSGGFFGAELKHAGFDAIIVEGQSERPVYLLILDGKAELKDAAHLWGKTTGDTEAILRQEVGERHLRISAIGPAGEKLVRYACIINDLRDAAGRTGMGAVMGSKRLKAIAVRGHQMPALARPDRVRELSQWMAQSWKDWGTGLHDTGTANNVMPLSIAGGLPTRNFREGAFEGAEKISGETLRDTILIKRGSCFACPVQCKREVRVDAPWNVDPVYGGPEYETIGALGSCCGVDNLAAIAKGNELCNAYGIDTISTGLSIAFAMECFEKGLLTRSDTDGIDLRFGNAEAMVQMVEAIARRQGLGDLLAEGVKRAAEQIGGEAKEYAMHVKGEELPLHEPRLKAGLGLGYAVSPTGADHVHNIHDTMFVKPGMDLDRLKSMGVLDPIPAGDLSEKKVRVFYYDGLWRYAVNSFVTCVMVRWTPEKITEVINAITGWNSTFLEVHNVGRKSATMARLFNLREGFTSEDDTLPKRILGKFAGGPLAGVGVDEARLRQAVVTFYQMAGWTEQGVPTRAHLTELGLGWAAEALPATSRA